MDTITLKPGLRWTLYDCTSRTAGATVACVREPAEWGRYFDRIEHACHDVDDEDDEDDSDDARLSRSSACILIRNEIHMLRMHLLSGSDGNLGTSKTVSHSRARGHLLRTAVDFDDIRL